MLGEDDENIFQQPDPAVTAAILGEARRSSPPAPTIITETLPDGMDGKAYSPLTFCKGYRAITWTIVEGVLPEGLELNENTGKISGTPTREGNRSLYR